MTHQQKVMRVARPHVTSIFNRVHNMLLSRMSRSMSSPSNLNWNFLATSLEALFEPLAERLVAYFCLRYSTVSSDVHLLTYQAVQNSNASMMGMEPSTSTGTTARGGKQERLVLLPLSGWSVH